MLFLKKSLTLDFEPSIFLGLKLLVLSLNLKILKLKINFILPFFKVFKWSVRKINTYVTPLPVCGSTGLKVNKNYEIMKNV